MIIRCPKCATELELPEGTLGRKVRCCDCNEKFFIATDGSVRLLPEYVLPDGAQWDSPPSGEMILPYNNLITTLGFSYLDVTCDDCQGTFRIAFRRMIDATNSPSYEAALASGDYYNFTCPYCGGRKTVGLKICVWNLRKNYLIHTVFDYAEMQRKHQKASIAAEALGLPPGSLDRVRQRLVWNVAGLVEKIRVMQTDMPDYYVELAKEIVNQRVNALAPQEIYYARTDDKHLVFELSGGRSCQVWLERSTYNDLQHQFETLGGFREGILRWVHWKVMRRNYDDWFIS